MTQNGTPNGTSNGKPNKIRQHKKAAFLAAFAETGNISAAATAANINRCMHYEWAKDDPKYCIDFMLAKEEAVERLEQEARRRAVDGLRRLKFTPNGIAMNDPDTGKPYTEHVYSDTLLIFLLKGAAPEKYRERRDVQVGGEVKVEVIDCKVEFDRSG